jgi:RNA polymerase sigma factor (sigma-70 family)
MEHDLDRLVEEARQGSKEALELVIQYTQGYIYNLAIRMLKSPADAEDATQEILIKLVTHLGQFRGESAFMTWAYRIASNTLLNIDQRDKRRAQVSFEDVSLRLEQSLALSEESAEEAREDSTLAEEVKRSCTLGMLLCLQHEDRLALILAELMGVSGEEGAYIMDISPAAYRKRLSRARMTLVTFVSNHCGIVNPANPCRCHKHVQNKVRAGLLDSNNLLYAQTHNNHSVELALEAQQATLDQAQRTMALFRSHPEYATRADFAEIVQQIFKPTDQDIDQF